VRTFSRNAPKLRGLPGAIAVLHTYNRRQDIHPHAHPILPAAALDPERRQWRTKVRPSSDLPPGSDKVISAYRVQFGARVEISPALGSAGGREISKTTVSDILRTQNLNATYPLLLGRTLATPDSPKPATINLRRSERSSP